MQRYEGGVVSYHGSNAGLRDQALVLVQVQSRQAHRISRVYLSAYFFLVFLPVYCLRVTKINGETANE